MCRTKTKLFKNNVVTSLADMAKKYKFFGFRKIYFKLRNVYYKIKRSDIYYKLDDLAYPKATSGYISNEIIREYNGFLGHGVEISPPFIGLGLLHYSLIRIIKPKRILCIGSLRGFIPVLCALACQDNEKGFVDFVRWRSKEFR